MGDLPKTCINCTEVLECKYLADSKGFFVPERVITEDYFRDCPDWKPVGPHQKWIRDIVFSLQGEGGVRVLHQMPRIIMNDLVQTEQEEEEMNIDDNPNFSAMLREGMTTAEREEQLRYETDEAGTVLVDEQGQKRPRAQYVISRFACDQDQHIQLDHSSGMFYKMDDVIKYILDKEVELGLLVKSKRPKKETKVADPQNVDAISTQKETIMPIEGRKIIRPTARTTTVAQEPEPTQAPDVQGESAPPAAPKMGPVGLPKVAGMAKVAQPPKRPGVGATAQPAETMPHGIDISRLIPELENAVSQCFAKQLHAVKNEIVAELTAKIEAVSAETKEAIISAITILHDLSCQTGGTFAIDGTALSEKFDCTDKILDYLKG